MSHQIAQAAMAIQSGHTVKDAANADLPYDPPFSLRDYEAARLIEAAGYGNSVAHPG